MTCRRKVTTWRDRDPRHHDALFATLIHLGELDDELVEAEMDVEPIRPHRGLVLGWEDDRIVGVLGGWSTLDSSPGRSRCTVAAASDTQPSRRV